MKKVNLFCISTTLVLCACGQIPAANSNIASSPQLPWALKEKVLNPQPTLDWNKYRNTAVRGYYAQVALDQSFGLMGAAFYSEDGKNYLNIGEKWQNTELNKFTEKEENDLLMRHIASSIDKSKLVKIKGVTGKHEIIVIGAIDCPWTHKLFDDFELFKNKTNTTLYILPGVLNINDNPTISVAQQISCSEDKYAKLKGFFSFIDKKNPGFPSELKRDIPKEIPGCNINEFYAHDISAMYGSAVQKKITFPLIFIDPGTPSFQWMNGYFRGASAKEIIKIFKLN